MAKPKKFKGDMDWLGMEGEIREVLGNVSNMCYLDALRCIDEIVARYTRRGNSMPAPSEEEYQRLASQYPKYFKWED